MTIDYDTGLDKHQYLVFSEFDQDEWDDKIDYGHVQELDEREDKWGSYKGSWQFSFFVQHHGKGKKTYHDGSIYEGWWVQGKRDG